MRNVEIKAIVNDSNEVKLKAQQLSGCEPTIIQQVDKFYNTPKGRLKLRQFSDDTGELIYYERPDTKGPKLCNFIKAEFESKQKCETMDNILFNVHGHLGVVKKTRLLYLVGQSRIHVDDVNDLGSFMEIEVVLTDNQNAEDGEKIANDLMAKLGIAPDNLISKAYIDLLLEKKKNNGQ